jgi:hypothetical protein
MRTFDAARLLVMPPGVAKLSNNEMRFHFVSFNPSERF